MIDIEVLGSGDAPTAPSEGEILALCTRAAASRGVSAGHVAIEFVDAERIAALNREHRGKPEPTDVLSFPIDGATADTDLDDVEGPPRELGDIVICPAHTEDMREALLHGMLHLLGMDHEHDDGEMLALQHRLLGAGAR
ncbi:MAG TPA: rRNA maturation RNase YbeY [Solirubrobacteraceae bacterium]|jgi:probable rRNA maturation factor